MILCAAAYAASTFARPATRRRRWWRRRHPRQHPRQGQLLGLALPHPLLLLLPLLPLLPPPPPLPFAFPASSASKHTKQHKGPNESPNFLQSPTPVSSQFRKAAPAVFREALRNFLVLERPSARNCLIRKAPALNWQRTVSKGGFSLDCFEKIRCL
jgi:hypothetical protein